MKTKRNRFVICMLVFAVLLAIPFGSRAAGNERKLTIMVYMCGSNLESEGGAATADINEMIAATKDGCDATLLVMTGGSLRWASGADPNTIRILEIRKGRSRELTQMGQADMGNGRTLTSFMAFGAERFPAENYALILWDHGGGPLEGVCWDEVFSMNHMSLPGLQDAIASAGLGKKLSWIGFDACLMGSLEVAAELSDLADYMIASEEKEPASGWNYSFLQGLTGEEAAEKIGRKIVDAYFEGNESKQTKTLACINLKEAAEAAEDLGSYFGGLRDEISAGTFAQFSGARKDATAFGVGIKGAEEEDDGYDLVDAGSLVALMDQHPQEKEKLESSLDQAVVYSRSNLEGSTGLTLYYPFGNKKQYLSGWRDSYSRMDIIPGYAGYMQSFGTILTGEKLLRWKNLFTESAGKNTAGEPVFSLRLTEEQREHFSSAQLLILQDTWNGGSLGNAVTVVSVCPAVLDENGVVTGAYDGSMLYAESQEYGLIGPLSVLPADQGRTEAIYASYQPREDYSLQKNQDVLYFLDRFDPNEHPEVIRREVFDDATQHFSGRLDFSEDSYRMIHFWNQNRVYPEPDEGVLPDYYSWTRDDASISMKSLALPAQWSFVRKKEQLTGVQLYALFRITDAQQNTVCSIPVAVDNPNLSAFTATLREETKPEDFDVKMEGQINLAPPQSLKLTLEITNKGTADTSFAVKSILLNESREAGSGSGTVTAAAGKTGRIELELEKPELAEIDQIRRIDIRMTKKDPTGEEESVSLSFDIEGCSLREMSLPESISEEKTSDGVTVKILELQPDSSSGFNITVLMENDGKTSVLPECVTVNGFQLENAQAPQIEPGHSRVFQAHWENGMVPDNNVLSVPGIDQIYYHIRVMRDLLGLHDQKEVREIGVYWTTAGQEIQGLTAALKEPWPVNEPEKIGAWNHLIEILDPEEAGQKTELLPLLRNDRCDVDLRRVIIGKESILLILEARNKTGQPIQLLAEELQANDGEIPFIVPLGMLLGETILPESTKVFGLELKNDQESLTGKELREISVSLREQGELAASPAVILLNVPALMSGEKLIWLDADHLTTREATMVQHAQEPLVFIENEILLEPNAAQYRHWIDLPVSEAEMEELKSGTAYLVMPVEEKYLALISAQSLVRNQEGTVGVWIPGLVAACAGHDEDILPVIVTRADSDGLEGKIGTSLYFENEDIMNYKRKRIGDIQFEVNYDPLSGKILQMDAEEDAFISREEIATVTCYLSVIDPGEAQDGRLPGFDQIEYVTDWSYGWYEMLENRPMQIQLRPIREEDQIRVLFSLTRKDGTKFCVITP